MTKSKLSLSECYKNLQITKNASMEEVKQAYRKLALALHPDLNPNNPKAHHNFQMVNESYVTIISHLSEEENKAKQKAEAKKAKQEAMAQKAKEEEQRKKERLAQKEKEREERKAREEQLDERKRAKERQLREENERIRLREQMERSESALKAKKEAKRQEILRQEAAHKEQLIKQMQAEIERNKQTKFSQHTKGYSKSGRPIVESRYNVSSKKNDMENNLNSSQNSQNFSGQEEVVSDKIFNGNKTKEEILQELLEDESAQQIYRDIYNELNAKINSEDNQAQEIVQEEHKNSVQNDEKTKKTSVEQDQTDSVLNNVIEQTGQITTGIKQGLSSWLKSQIDEEMELYFPAAKLIGGAKLRLQIKEGWSGELQTVDLNLPLDFVPGRPIRLKGMGKKVGKWKGDLYLKLKVR